MKELAKKTCLPCIGAVTPLKGKDLEPLYLQLGGEWEIIEEHHLKKTFQFKTFKQALTFANMIGQVADEAGHHPDLHVSWGQLVVTIWTHKIDGLSESDFILAAKIETEWVSHEG